MTARIVFDPAGNDPNDPFVVLDGPVPITLPPAASMPPGTIIRHGSTGRRFIRGFVCQERYCRCDDADVPGWQTIGAVDAWSTAHPSAHAFLSWFAWLSIIAGVIAVIVGAPA